jgi:hypothetical protein
VEIPPDIERAIEEEVARNLQAELDNRGLLLVAGALAEAEAAGAERGTRLLRRAISVCYPTSRQSVGGVSRKPDNARLMCYC